MKVPIAAELCSNQAFAGRISMFQSNWKALTNYSWVLETVVKGYHIPLISNPVQQTLPHCPRLPHEDQIALEDEIKSLLQKQAIQHLPTPPLGFYSNMFMVPKKGGGQRPVINLKHLNQFVKLEHLRWRAYRQSKLFRRRTTGWPR